MPDRFFAPVSFDEKTVRLEGPEARHMQVVLRLRAGDEVVLFDGEGTEATATIVSMKKNEVELRIEQVRPDPPDRSPRIVLATAVPKGERFRWLVEKSVELGVDRLIPLNTARSVVDPRETRLDKLRTLVIAACKQSRRNRLMRIEPSISWTELIAQYTRPRDEQSEGIPRTIIIADPSGVPVSRELTLLGEPTIQQAHKREILLIVGPEGGFSAEELRRARESGAKLVSLGSQILRIETAAIALAALFSRGID